MSLLELNGRVRFRLDRDSYATLSLQTHKMHGVANCILHDACET